MHYFPVFFRVAEQPCLVVGGGNVADRKVSLLLRAGARVTVVAPQICRQLVDRDVEVVRREFEEADVIGQRLVIAATDQRASNRRVAQACEARNIPVNVVDDPQHSRFIVPAIVDRSPIVVGISSGGNSPVLARLLRSKIEAALPARVAVLAQVAGRLRDRVKRLVPDGITRRRFWHNTLQRELTLLDESSEPATVEQRVVACLDDAGAAGVVYLVGAGPGSPDHLTLRAHRALQQADVIVYDRLVADAVVDLGRRDAERVYVGKAPGAHSRTQEEINALLVHHALKGRTVVRLKGGDPGVFGRVGEECEALERAAVRYEVVPGVTAASCAAAALKIPLTHRDCSDRCILVTGHRSAERSVDWPALARPRQTVVFYMVHKELSETAKQLIGHGLARGTPAALVSRVSHPDEAIHVGTIGGLADGEGEHQPGPAVLIVGDVVAGHRVVRQRQVKGSLRYQASLH